MLSRLDLPLGCMHSDLPDEMVVTRFLSARDNVDEGVPCEGRVYLDLTVAAMARFSTYYSRLIWIVSCGYRIASGSRQHVSFGLSYM